MAMMSGWAKCSLATFLVRGCLVQLLLLLPLPQGAPVQARALVMPESRGQVPTAATTTSTPAGVFACSLSAFETEEALRKVHLRNCQKVQMAIREFASAEGKYSSIVTPVKGTLAADLCDRASMAADNRTAA
eukprot:CAMPEP_0168458884 /NCGR_PEP_ID=MMETSP0228-20121227/52619_1 /TAXON_ID=133427 /ORGANISM="Protoceratium reticulatum, Strain CCCM 535 (=CCMP 1889)" /LENGTH=131 /DNA_ID=CAMNT_0008474021 /DNA_START=18 /DNA_END=411 /DNA_ORIENTATION=+